MKKNNLTLGIRLCMVLCLAAWLQSVANFFRSSNLIINHAYMRNGPHQQSMPRSKDSTLSSSSSSSQAASATAGSVMFEPGSLDMEKKDTIAKCWTSSPRKQEQRIKTTQNCLYSSRYQLSASLSGKTGTSTQKQVLQKTMNAREIPCHTIPHDGSLIQIATVREPLDRFISGYKETLFREDVYQSDFEEQDIPTEYSRFLSILKQKSPEEKQAIFKAETPHHLQLKTQMFEMFVQDYDGENVFDRHLNSQTIKLWDPYGVGMGQYDFIMEVANLTQDLGVIANRVGAPIYPSEVAARNRSMDLIDVDALHDETIQKICRLFALDYCCLNYELPPACQRAPVGQRVRCDWVVGSDPQDKEMLQIRDVLA